MTNWVSKTPLQKNNALPNILRAPTKTSLIIVRNTVYNFSYSQRQIYIIVSSIFLNEGAMISMEKEPLLSSPIGRQMCEALSQRWGCGCGWGAWSPTRGKAGAGHGRVCALEPKQRGTVKAMLGTSRKGCSAAFIEVSADKERQSQDFPFHLPAPWATHCPCLCLSEKVVFRKYILSNTFICRILIYKMDEA